MQKLPVTLAVPGDADTTERFHVIKFVDAEAASVRLCEWEGGAVMRRVRETETGERELVDVPETLMQETDPARRLAGLEELNKNEWILQNAPGNRVFHGKRLASAGNFALLIREGNAVTLAPVHEWFEFTKKTSVKPMSIEEAEAHLQELQRKSVTQAMLMNRRMAVDKLAADAAVVEAKRAIVNKEVSATCMACKGAFH